MIKGKYLVLLVGLLLLPTISTTITIGIIERPPFVMQNENGSMTGFSIELWDEIKERSQIDSVYHKFDIFSEMIDAVENKDIDGAIANITITAKREALMDYSQPIYDSGLQIMIPHQKTGFSFIKVIWESGVFWFIFGALLLLLIIAHILWFFERGVTDRRHDYFRDDYFGGVWDAFWWAFIIMTMGGFENEVPHKKVSRILAIFWIVASLFFISTLTAKITTSLTVNELSNTIESVEDLVGKRVGVMEGPTVREYLAPFGIRVVEYQTPKKLYRDMHDGKLDAVVGDAPIIQYYVKHSSNGTAHLTGSIFKLEKYGVLFPENSILKEGVDQAILEIQEDGTYQKLLKKYFGK